MMLPFVNILPSAPASLGSAKTNGSDPITLGNGDGQTFDSLMSLFGMAEPGSSALAPIINGGAVDDLQSGGHSGSSEQIETLLATLLSSANNQNQLPGFTSPTPRQLEVPVASVENFTLAGPEQQFTKHDDSNMFGQQVTLPVAQPWTMIMTQQRPVNLKPGNYQVLKQELQDGKLTLDLKGANQASEPIKVTIPIELLHQESRVSVTPAAQQSAGVNIRPSRTVPLQPRTSDLKALLDKVNVREMQISTEPTASVVRATDEPYKVQLFAEQAGQNLVLSGKLDRTQLKAQATTRKTVSAVALLPTNDNPTPAAENALTVDTVSLPRQRSLRRTMLDGDFALQSEDSKLIQKLMTGTAKNDLSADTQSELLTKAGAQSARPADQRPMLDLPKVKITLPQETPQLGANGKTVLLKIEPEHLGPARLQLTVRNESLSARVTVDSVQAKAAVEQSLDQLNDQLARAGVKVNFIEVNVRGGGADSQFFHRQAEWFRSQQPRVAKFTDNLLAEAAILAPVSTQVSYIGAGSVNLYA